MSRLIDGDALKENLQNHYGVVEQDCGASKDFVDGTFMGLDAAMYEIDSAHTIDAIPVEWLRKKRVTHPTTDAEILHNSVIRAVLVMWEREQEAR